MRILRSGFLICFGVCAMHVRAQAASAVQHMDENRLRGTWYEIARLPNKKEKACATDAVELIARADKTNHLEWMDACFTKAGFTESRNLMAKPADKLGDGRYKVTSLWPFSKKYSVLAIGDSNDWLVIGTQDHKGLWIYAKTASLDPATLQTAEAHAASSGYQTAKLMQFPQTPQ